MKTSRLVMLTQRRTHGEACARMQQRTRDAAVHQRLLRAARQMIVQWRRDPSGAYRIPPGAVLALCSAVDESWDFMKGVEE
jgi:hypothetical protein